MLPFMIVAMTAVLGFASGCLAYKSLITKRLSKITSREVYLATAQAKLENTGEDVWDTISGELIQSKEKARQGAQALYQSSFVLGCNALGKAVNKVINGVTE